MLFRSELAAEPGKAPERPPEKPAGPARPARRVVEKDGEVEVEHDAVRPAVKLSERSASTAGRKPAKVAKASRSGEDDDEGNGDGGAAPTSSLVSELERLVSLRKQGVLSEDEFQSLKKRLLAGAT